MKHRVYSPKQIFTGTMLGGTLAATYLLWRNFRNLGKEAAARNALFWGFAALAGFWVIWSMLREHIPRQVFAGTFTLVPAVAAYLMAANWQLPRDTIRRSDRYSFQSNWRVVLVIIVAGPITFALSALYAIAFHSDVRHRAQAIVLEFEGRRAIDKHDFAAALTNFDHAVALVPADSDLYYMRGWVKSEKGDTAGAIADYRQAVAVSGTNAVAYNNLAWLLATADKPSLRDGPSAVVFGLKACELSNWKNPAFIGTLSAAYARAGQFDKAVEMHLKAVEVSGRPDSAKGEERLRLYRAGKAWPP